MNANINIIEEKNNMTDIKDILIPSIKESGIYAFKNIENGKLYIGQSMDMYHRISQHIRGHNSNIYLQNAINKYGIEKFEISILCRCSIEDLDNMEIFYIDKYNTTNRKYGYNFTIGGKVLRGKNSPNWGHITSDETKAKIGAANSLHKGRKVSELTRKKMSESNRIYRQKDMKPVLQILNGHVIGEYESISAAGKALNINTGCISNVCKHNTLLDTDKYTYAGFAWKFNTKNKQESINTIEEVVPTLK